MVVKSPFHRYLIDIYDFWRNTIAMSFTIIFCDIELEHYLQILVNKHLKHTQGMLGVLT